MVPLQPQRGQVWFVRPKTGLHPLEFDSVFESHLYLGRPPRLENFRLPLVGRVFREQGRRRHRLPEEEEEGRHRAAERSGRS